MGNTGLFAVQPGIAIATPACLYATLDHIRSDQLRPWAEKFVDTSCTQAGILRFARVVRPEEESIKRAEYQCRLDIAASLGVMFPGWSQAEWLYETFDSIPPEQGPQQLMELIRNQGLAANFVGTHVYREHCGWGEAAILPGNHKLDLHAQSLDWAMHRLVACFIPEGVVLDN